jgi:hypothetical protein
MELVEELNGAPVDSPAARQPARSRFFPFIFSLVVFLEAAIPMFGQGGNFSAGVNYPVPGQGVVAIGDLNGDTKPDIIVTNGDSTVSILIGNGDRTLQPQYTVMYPENGPAVGTALTDSLLHVCVPRCGDSVWRRQQLSARERNADWHVKGCCNRLFE